MDIDMLGRVKNDEDGLKIVFTEMMKEQVDDDGLIFLPETIQYEQGSHTSQN